MIKAIETEYNGYKFRSRLEARWAVFFDALGIQYHYEPEGFDLDGVYYLPDFYLDDYKIYIEIKPFDKDVVSYVGDGNKWEQKCRSFRDDVDKAIMICYGDPSDSGYYYFFGWDLTDGSGGSSEFQALFFEKTDGTIKLFLNDGRYDREIFVAGWNTGNELISSENIKTCASLYSYFQDGSGYDIWDKAIDQQFIPFKDNNSAIAKAQMLARQARFEHGEKPCLNTSSKVSEDEIPF